LLAARRERSPSVVLFRRGTPRRPDHQTAQLISNLPAIEGDIDQGCIVVIEPGRVRLRRLPLIP
jgi:hypothetical protein